jgi:hypothetical protein
MPDLGGVCECAAATAALALISLVIAGVLLWFARFLIDEVSSSAGAWIFRTEEARRQARVRLDRVGTAMAALQAENREVLVIACVEGLSYCAVPNGAVFRSEP